MVDSYRKYYFPTYYDYMHAFQIMAGSPIFYGTAVLFNEDLSIDFLNYGSIDEIEQVCNLFEEELHKEVIIYAVNERGPWKCWTPSGFFVSSSLSYA